MLNKTKIALAAVLVLGGASVATAGEGSPDLSNSPAFSESQSIVNDGAFDAYAQTGTRQDRFVFERAPARGVSAAQERLFERESGSVDNN